MTSSAGGADRSALREEQGGQPSSNQTTLGLIPLNQNTLSFR